MLKDNIKKWLNYILLFFLIVQPVFDLKIFYNSYSTLIRAIAITVFFVLLFFNDKNRKKYYVFLYIICMCMFFVFHNNNALCFKSLVPNNFSYSSKKEILYFIKMLVPLMLLYVLYNSNITNEQLRKVIKNITLLIGGSIIITNLFCIAYGSYTDVKIEKNIFFWFSKESQYYTYKDLLSKGLFEYANQVGAVLIMFLPFNIYSNFNNGKNKLTIIVNLIAIILLGTRVAVLGVVIVFLYVIFIRIFCLKYNKEKITNKKEYIFMGILIIAYLMFLPKNPVFNRIDEMVNLQEKTVQVVNQNEETISENQNSTDNFIDNSTEDINNNTIEENQLDEGDAEKNEKLIYIKENYKDKEILEHFVLYSYPYQYDPDFWIDIMNKDIKTRTNYRYVEKEMVKRVIEYNNNFGDVLFGISYVRIQNIFNIEQDFIVQYYSIGIIGCIIIFLPYFSLLMKKAFDLIKAIMKKIKISEEKIISLTTIVFMYVIAYNSGNLLNSLSFTLYFSIVYAILLKKDKKEEENVY